jgi:hypothetical protein
MSFKERQRCEIASDQLTDEALDLPPNMAALAHQLSDEAAWLAERYPARAPGSFAAIATAAATPARRWRRLIRFGVASGVCAATVLVAIIAWQAVNNRDNAVSDGRAPIEQQSSQVAQLNDASGLGRQNGETIGAEENILKGLSGAEQEAVLDLIESHAAHKTSLSI